ncbi:MAG: phosphoribosylformylglycinamidine synthase subunit PurS [Gemmatimonadales bacterium]|nr:phosphoribosylformylglycinamidine synthase subunit PurS [Gemmatimonadales bacterium]
MTFQVHVRVMPRTGLLDPQGQAVEHALASLGFDGAGSVRIGRAIELAIEADSPADAERRVREMCDRLLANPVTEDYTLDVGTATREAA